MMNYNNWSARTGNFASPYAANDNIDNSWNTTANDFVAQCLSGNKSNSRLNKEKIISTFLEPPCKRDSSDLDYPNTTAFGSQQTGYNDKFSNSYKKTCLDVTQNYEVANQNSYGVFNTPHYGRNVPPNDKHREECELFLNNINKKRETVSYRERSNSSENLNSRKSFESRENCNFRVTSTSRERLNSREQHTSKNRSFDYEDKNIEPEYIRSLDRDSCDRKNDRREDIRKTNFVNENRINNIHDSSNVFKGISKALRSFDNKQSTSPKDKADYQNLSKAFLDKWDTGQFRNEREFVRNFEQCVNAEPDKILEAEEKKWTVSATSHYKLSFENPNIWEANDECKQLTKTFEDLIQRHFANKAEPAKHTRPQRKRHRCNSYEGYEDDSKSENSSSDERIEEHDCVVKELQLKQQHPNRLHSELWYNDPGELNDGPLCRCSQKSRKFGIRHNIYNGEGLIEKCNPFTNNGHRLYNYRVVISPSTNLFVKTPTRINFNNEVYTFEGFSLFSHYPIPNLPVCKVIRFNINYSILHVNEPVPFNFSIYELDLFSKYFFREILELVDFNLYPPEQTEEGCPMFHLMPRFVRPVTENCFELLPMCEVIKYLVDSNKPLIYEEELEEVSKLDHVTWQNRINGLKGMIMTKPGAKPCSVRVDQLDKDLSDHPDDLYPDIVHFGIRPAQLSYAGNKKYQRLWRSYIKYRHLLANLSKPTAVEKLRLQAKEQALNKIKTRSKLKRGVTAVLSSRGFFKTGIMCDMVQHALLIPVLICHLRFHRSLNSLEDRMGYNFKDRSLLQLALTHPSYRENFGTNPDHVRNTLSNCGVRQPEYGDRRIHYQNTRKRGINTLINIMSKFGKISEMPSSITHNERLEFLGDAVIELVTSIHLYFLFPDIEEGGLATYRAAIVQNQNLTLLAQKLNLDHYLLFAHGSDLCHDLELRHALANCFEALLAALYLDGGLEVADKVFSKTFLGEYENSVLNCWMKYPKHPIQEQEPDGDRKWISKFPLLQRITKLEESIGVEFTHIRLLARAFTDRSIGYTNLALGSNQRMEFLGDTVLQLICSTYLYKHFPDHHEGHLSLLRSSLVNNRTQSIVCDDLSMSSYALYANSKDVYKVKDRADILEAFLGALFIDKGMEYCLEFCGVCFFPRLQEFIVNQHWNDPKSKLQQCCLTLRNAEGFEPDIPVYKVIECKGPTNGRIYKVAVYFKGERLAAANGHNIQQAEMNAARQALTKSQDLFPKLNHQRREIDKNLHRESPEECETINGGAVCSSSRGSSNRTNSSVDADHSAIINDDHSDCPVANKYAGGTLGDLLQSRK